ncbi:MAG TPA: LysR substrate-binding domain-containing protein, partial [Afipia sp.]
AEVRHNPRLITDDMALLRDAALAGVGAVRLPTLAVWDDLRSGDLVTVLPEWKPSNEIVHAVFASRRGLLPSVRALLDYLADECSAQRLRVPESGID